MGDARGDALEWALALARAPGERMTLRQRPLPEGIEPLLQIAAGSRGEALQSALARSDEPEDALVEAVRFYLREVLFHSGADAYRMLGLAHDASPEQIKSHHRLLQQWLHPDRHTSDCDAIFAGRVNAAWNALRTPELRAAYDKAHPAVATAAPSMGSIASRPAPRVVPLPHARGDGDRRWRRRAPVLVLFTACVMLGVAAVRDALRPPETGYTSDAQQAAGPRRVDADAVALRLPQPAEPAPKPGRAAAPSRPASVRPAAAIASGTADARVPGGDAVALTGAIDVPGGTPASAPIPARTSRPRAPAAADAMLAAADTRATSAAQAPVEAPARVASAAAPVSAEAAPAPQVPAAATAPATASAERVQQAQRTGRELMAFLSSRGARVPPIWDSMAAQQRALGLRERLHASGELRPGEPHWRVGSEDAALQALFGEDSNVRAQLVWREQRWLVSGVALEDAP